MKKETVLMLLIVLLSLFLNIYGSRWAGPDASRLGLVFGDSETVKALSGEMVKSRDEIYQNMKYYLQDQNYEERTVKVTLKNGRTIETKRTIIDAARSFLLRSFAPDEQATLKTLANMKPSRLNFNPRFFFYGGLYIYLLAAFLQLASILGIAAVKPDVSFYFLQPQAMGMLFTSGKIFGAAFVSLASIFVYRTGSELYSRRAGLIAALLFAVNPAVVVWSHYLNPYAYTFFWAMLALFLCAKLFRNNKAKDYILSGATAGLATGSLTLYGFALFAIPITEFLKNTGKGLKAAVLSLFGKKVWLALLMFGLAFLAVNPYFVSEIRQIRSDFSAADSYYPFRPSFTSVRYYIQNSVVSAFGLPACLLAACGTAYALFRRRKGDMLLLLLSAAVLLYFSCSMTYFMHYGLFLIPLLTLMSARLIDDIFSKGRTLKVAGIVILAAVLVYSFSYSLSMDIAASRKNTRTAAGEWINKNISPGSSIGMMEPPSPWRTPPFRLFDYRLSVTGLDKAGLKKARPEYFIVEEHQWVRGPKYAAMLDLLSGYEEVGRFENFPRVLGMTFKRDDNTPWDWPDINPVVLVFRLKAG